MTSSDAHQHQKVHVAVGNNLQEGLATLEWAIQRFSSHPISIVVIHAKSAISNEIVNTPFGKMPASAVNEEKLQGLRKYEDEKIDRMLSKYTAFCGKVKAEIHKIERCDKPIQKVMLELIMELHITKLVMAISFMRPSSGRSKSAISGSFYLDRNKPEFCDVYILCAGKLLFAKEDNQQEEQMEDQEPGEMRLKQKPNFTVLASGRPTPYQYESSSLPESKNQWNMYSQEVEEYFQQLLEEKNEAKSPIEPLILSSAKISEDKLEAMRMQILEAKRMTQLKKEQAKAEAERQAKASWAISLCNQRAEELEAIINEEISTRIDINREIEDSKEQIYEAMADIQESKSKLSSLSQVQSELSNKLQVSSSAKSRAETKLEKAANARADLVRDIEELRKKRGVLQRRIEFCKEKDAIGLAMSCRVDAPDWSGCKELSVDEIETATDKFSEHRRFKLGGEWTNVYKGRINHNSVAIKVLNLDKDAFQAKVNLLKSIEHENVVTLIGFCVDLRCLVFEYMQNGCLRDILFSRRKSKTLQWWNRVNIAAGVSSALGFLHQSESNSKPITHGSLNPSNILLDNNLVAKVDTYELKPDIGESTDVRALGVLLLQLLCGRNWAGVDQEELVMIGKQPVYDALDESAGEWPLDLVEEILEVAMKCILADSVMVLSSAVKALSLVKNKSDRLLQSEKPDRRREFEGGELVGEDDESSVPDIFVCPIFQEMMENPHIAADGYSYEFDAIEEWLQTGNETSPLTKTRLEHKHLTPNHALRAFIQEWRSDNSHLCS